MKLRFIVLFSLFFGFMLFTSCSYASMSTSTKNLIYSQCQTLNEKGVISTATLEYINSKLYNSNTFNGSNFGNDYFILIGKGSRYNGGGHNYSKLSTNMSIYIGCCKTGATSIVNYTNDTNNSFYTNWSTSSVWGGFRCNVNNKTDYSEGNFGYNDALDGFYIYSTLNLNTRLVQISAGQEYGGQYLLYYGPTFTSSNNGTIPVYNNNFLFGIANRLPFGYVFPTDTTLGYLSDYSDVDYIYGYFGRVAYLSGDTTITDDKTATFDFSNGTTRNGSLRFDYSTGRISVENSRLIENNCYYLYLGYKVDDDWLDITDNEVLYYAYYINSSPLSGDLINPNVNTDIDFEWINSVDYSLNNNDDNVYMIGLPTDFDFSGDFLSGDILGISYRNYDTWGLGDYVYHAFEGIINVLTSYDDITLNMGILGIWSTADFVMPHNTFFTFVSLIANGLLSLYGIWFLWRFINMISTFDLDGITSTDDVLNFF